MTRNGILPASTVTSSDLSAALLAAETTGQLADAAGQLAALADDLAARAQQLASLTG